MASSPIQSGSSLRRSFNAKTRQWSAQCSYCKAKGLGFIKDARPENLLAHILGCEVASTALKESVMVAHAAGATPDVPTRTRTTLKAGANKHAANITSHFPPLRATDAVKEELHRKLQKWAVMCGVAFNALDSVYFLDFLATTRPGYMPPGECDNSELYMHHQGACPWTHLWCVHCRPQGAVHHADAEGVHHRARGTG